MAEYRNENLYHELVQIAPGKRQLHIWVYGHDLTGGERVLTGTDKDRLLEDQRFFDLLNDKAKESLEDDPDFIITKLSDWRRWAGIYMNEFYEEQENELENKILASREHFRGKN